MAALDELVGALADLVAERVVAKLTAGQQPGMLDQVGSPLGRRRHIAACRARVGRGESGAAIVGRRHLLSREALEAELETLGAVRSKARASTPKAKADDDLAAARERYGVTRRSA